MSDLPPKVRLFVAINLPEDVQERLRGLNRASTERCPPGIRWTPTEQIHLTLKFFGDVDSVCLKDLETALRRTCTGIKPFALEAASVGAFPDLRRPRVLWAGIQGDMATLSALQARVQRETEAWGKREEHAFSPHLTIGRVREGERPDLRDWVEKNRAARFGSWQVGKIHLMRSVLSPDGAQYSELAVIGLPDSNAP